jgi:serine/threonine protein kinase
MQQTAPNVEEIFFAALELESQAARSAFLDRACVDTELRQRVERLLAHDVQTNGFLEAPASSPTVSIALEGHRGVEGPGTVIGPYKLLEVIGEGGMGTVYMAEQTEPVRRRVALKVIKPGMDSKQVVARFEAERQALAMMDHPNIAKVHDAGMTPSNRPYFVMELVRGLPITEYCDEQRLSIAERLELFILVCRAVQHAHQKGVIHRDLKPSNVLVTIIDGVGVPKVIDFGVAKATGQALTDKTLFTGFHQFVGTPLYVSPEQAELSGVDVDTRSDIYSLGVLLYELLTGATPFDSETLKRAAFDEMRRIIREEEPPRPSTRLTSLGETLSTVAARRKADPRRLGASMKGELDWVVMKALEKDRRRRYETANDFAADVLRYLTDQTVEACPPTAWYRFSKFARRNRLSLAFGTSAGAALVLAVIGLTAGLLLISREQAKTAKAYQAEARQRQLARNAVDDMYTQVAEKWLGDQPNLTRLQREFLEKALGFYERFTGDLESDPRARQESVEALYRVGAIRQKLGEYTKAERALRRAVDQAVALARQDSNRPEYRLVLAESRLKLAEVLRDLGRPFAADIGPSLTFSDGKTSHYESEQRQKLASPSEQEIRQASRDLGPRPGSLPAEAALRRRLAEAHETLCQELTLARQLPEAEASVRVALEIRESLMKDSPEDLEDRLGLARNYSRQGMHYMWWGLQNEKAEAALRQAVPRLSTLRDQYPGEVRVRAALSSALMNLGVMLNRRQENSEAEVVDRQAVALLEGLTTDFPDVLRYQASLGSALNNLANDRAAQGRYDDLNAIDRRAVIVREKLADSHSEVPEYESDLQQSLRRFSVTLSRHGNVEEARQVADRAVRRARAYLEAHPEKPQNGNGLLANALHFRVPVVLMAGDRTAAAHDAEEWAHSILQFGFAPQRLGEAVSRLGEDNLTTAETAARDSTLPPLLRESRVDSMSLEFRALLQEATRQAPDNARSLYLLADSLSTAPDRLRDPERALALAEKAFTLEPQEEMTWQSLGWARYRVGDWGGCIAFLEKQQSHPKAGDFFAAMAHWRRGDRDKARQEFGRAERWLADYEKRWVGKVVYPYPSMIRRIRAEAEGLLGLEPTQDESRSKPAPRASGSPE